MQTTHKTETVQAPGVRVRSLPRRFPWHRRFVVWGRGLPYVLTAPVTLAVMEGMTLETLRVAGDPESVIRPYVLRVDRVIKGETVPVFAPKNQCLLTALIPPQSTKRSVDIILIGGLHPLGDRGLRDNRHRIIQIDAIEGHASILPSCHDVPFDFHHAGFLQNVVDGTPILMGLLKIFCERMGLSKDGTKGV